MAEKLAPILGVSASSLSQRMGQHRSGVRLASNLEPSTAARLKTLNIDGIDFEHGPQRIYPQGDLFANVLGFLNLERSPQAGLELSLDDKLRSQELKLGIRRSGDGTPPMASAPAACIAMTCACSSPSTPACNGLPSWSCCVKSRNGMPNEALPW